MKRVVTPLAGIEAFGRGYVSEPSLSDDQRAMLYLRRRIEALSALPVMWSRSACTSRGTVHVAFENGAIKREGEPSIGVSDDPLFLAEKTFAAVQNYYRSLTGTGDGPGQLAGLVWRCEPEIRREGGNVYVYCRLCFELAPELAVA